MINVHLSAGEARGVWAVRTLCSCLLLFLCSAVLAFIICILHTHADDLLSYHTRHVMVFSGYVLVCLPYVLAFLRYMVLVHVLALFRYVTVFLPCVFVWCYQLDAVPGSSVPGILCVVFHVQD